MRLRRETGDFSIVVAEDYSVAKPIWKNLILEDLLGVIVDYNGVLETVVKVEAGSTAGTFVATTDSLKLTYTKATGVVTAEAKS